jgi:hypothetical protein
MNKKPPPSSFLSEAQEFSLLAALLFPCYYAGLAACNLRDRQQSPLAETRGGHGAESKYNKRRQAAEVEERKKKKEEKQAVSLHLF